MRKQEGTKTMTQNGRVIYFYVASGEGRGEGRACGTAALSFQGAGLRKEHGPVEMGAASMGERGDQGSAFSLR